MFKFFNSIKYIDFRRKTSERYFQSKTTNQYKLQKIDYLSFYSSDRTISVARYKPSQIMGKDIVHFSVTQLMI